MDEERRRLMERERHQIEQIRLLDFEELQVEEVDGDNESSDDDDVPATGPLYEVAGAPRELTFNTSLASMHTYLGEVEDTHHRLAFLDGGAIHQLPLFYLEGVVLFPEATLPLRVVHPNFIAAIERALSQADHDAPLTIGVIRIYGDANRRRLKFVNTGTTAEIRQYRRLEDGSLNAVTRGQQRFRLLRGWIDADGVACGEVQIIQEDLPLRTPRDAFGKLPSLGTLPAGTSFVKSLQDDDSDAQSEDSFESALSAQERRLHESAIEACSGYSRMDESTSSDDGIFASDSEFELVNAEKNIFGIVGAKKTRASVGLSSKMTLHQAKGRSDDLRHSISRAFWPCWVYDMYDSYSLAQRAAELWKQTVGAPAMDGSVKKPDLLSFHIASKMPVSESIRQELLDIDGTSYRLRREIELLECFNRIRCKRCQTLIAKRSDMLVMSSDGPLGAYVNPAGYVHEIMTLYNANGLALRGRPDAQFSWFPGYAWTIANCATCVTHLGWLFTATDENLKPKLFWGVRSSQVADDMQ